MLCLMLNIAEYLMISVPVIYAINIYSALTPLVRNLIGLAHIVILLLLFEERFLLMLHYSSHRSVFDISLLNGINCSVFAAFFGVGPGMYKLHHNMMHHLENNHGLDATSTEEFQRDSFTSFLKYWFRFVFRIWYDLCVYVLARGRWDVAGNTLPQLAVWAAGMFCLCKFVSVVATVWIFIVPYLVSMSAMSFGNFSQHMFVNPDDCQSNYALTYNCLDSPTNQMTFNDGYHIVHHVNARLHWSEIPEYFDQTRDKHAKAGAITFRETHFFDVGMLVMTGQLRKLVEKHYVHIGPKEEVPTVDEVVIKLKRWLEPVPLAKRQVVASKPTKTE